MKEDFKEVKEMVDWQVYDSIEDQVQGQVFDQVEERVWDLFRNIASVRIQVQVQSQAREGGDK